MLHEINVGKDFSRHPAGRHPSDGKYSGETFRKKFLIAHLLNGDDIKISLDDAIDYGSSFLDEAFGGLVRIDKFDPVFLQQHIFLVSEDTILLYEIEEYLKGKI